MMKWRPIGDIATCTPASVLYCRSETARVASHVLTSL